MSVRKWCIFKLITESLDLQNLLIAEKWAELWTDSWEIDQNLTDDWDSSTPIRQTLQPASLVYSMIHTGPGGPFPLALEINCSWRITRKFKQRTKYIAIAMTLERGQLCLPKEQNVPTDSQVQRAARFVHLEVNFDFYRKRQPSRHVHRFNDLNI